MYVRIATVSATFALRKADLKIWDAATGRELLSQAINDVARIILTGSLAFSPDGYRLTLTPSRFAFSVSFVQ